MINKDDEVFIKKKQKDLGLTDEQCNKIIKYLKFGFTFTDAETEFEGFVLDYIDKKIRRGKLKGVCK